MTARLARRQPTIPSTPRPVPRIAVAPLPARCALCRARVWLRWDRDGWPRPTPFWADRDGAEHACPVYIDRPERPGLIA